jgi:hypothetical protein
MKQKYEMRIREEKRRRKNRENRGTNVSVDNDGRERLEWGARCRGNGTAVYVL